MKAKGRSNLLAMAGVTATMLGLFIGSQSTAFAATPAETVKPSTNLVNDQKVTVAVTGWGAAATLTVGECGTVSGKIYCDPGNKTTIVTNASGSGSKKMVVKLKFKGVLSPPPSAKSVAVNCATTTCFIGVGNGTAGTSVPISFK